MEPAPTHASDQFPDESVFDIALLLAVKSPSTLDEFACTLPDLIDNGDLTIAQSHMLMREAIGRSGIVQYETAGRVERRGDTPVRESLEADVLTRLERKMRRGAMDVMQFRTSSAASWTRTMTGFILGDRMLSYRRTGRLYPVSVDAASDQHDTTKEHGDRSWIKYKVEAATSTYATDEERLAEVMMSAEKAFYYDNGTRRRLTAADELHRQAAVMYLWGQWPAVVLPMLWTEREHVRGLLEADAAKAEESGGSVRLAARSLDPTRRDIPEALASMWDDYDQPTRAQMAASPDVAHVIALSAVTPMPRPRRQQQISHFVRQVKGLSADRGWKRIAPDVAEGFIGVFVDTGTYQSRTSPAVMSERLRSAERGRRFWDDLMGGGSMPGPVRPVAKTGCDLLYVLTSTWGSVMATSSLGEPADGSARPRRVAA